MKKETMIWQMLSMIIAGMVQRKVNFLTPGLFERNLIDRAQQVVDYSVEEIKNVLYNNDVT